MAEMKFNAVLGVMVLILASSLAYTLTETGKNLACSTGWSFQEIGDHEGMYKCSTMTSTRFEYCARVWDTTTGKVNYWCAQATKELVEIVDSDGYKASGEDGILRETWVCSSIGCSRQEQR